MVGDGWRHLHEDSGTGPAPQLKFLVLREAFWVVCAFAARTMSRCLLDGSWMVLSSIALRNL